MTGYFFDHSDESLEFPLKPGTGGTDDKEGDREHDKRGEDTIEIAAAIKMLNEVRKRLGCCRETIARIPESMMTDLARGQATQEIVIACAWIEEARDCLKKPLVEEEEPVWED